MGGGVGIDSLRAVHEVVQVAKYDFLIGGGVGIDSPRSVEQNHNVCFMFWLPTLFWRLCPRL